MHISKLKMRNNSSDVNKLGQFFVTVFILFITLRSYYFYSLSLSPLPLLGILISIMLAFLYSNNGLRIDKNTFILIITITMLMLIYTGLSIFTAHNLYVNSVIGVFLNIFCFSLILIQADFYKKHIRVLNVVLFIHVSAFLIQLIAFYIFGNVIDFIEPITGEVQRMHGFQKVEIDGLSLFRPAGLFNEPGNYSVYILTLLWVTKQTGFLNKVLEMICLATVVLSFSLFGIAVAMFYLLLNYYKEVNVFHLLILFIITALLYIVFYDLAAVYFEYRVANLGNDSSTQKRLYMFSLLSDLPESILLFGAGIGNDIIDMHMTTIPSIIIYFGLVGFFLFFLVFLLFSKIYSVSLKSILFFGAISFQFYTMSNTYFWVFFALLFVVSKQKNNLIRRL